MARTDGKKMTGYRSEHFRHQCSRDGCYVEQLPDWGEVIECFPRKIRPTDIDGMVEINNHFLFLEEKRCGASIEYGQLLAFKRLSSLPNATVVIFRPGTESELEVQVLAAGKGNGFEPSTWSEFFSRIRRWSINAEARSAA